MPIDNTNHMALLYEGYEMIECVQCSIVLDIEAGKELSEVRCPECGAMQSDDPNDREIIIAS